MMETRATGDQAREAGVGLVHQMATLGGTARIQRWEADGWPRAGRGGREQSRTFMG